MPQPKPEILLDTAIRAGWTQDLLAQEGLPEASLDFYWGEGDHGAVVLTSGKIRAFHLFEEDDLPSYSADADQRAETLRFVKRADEIMIRLKNEVKAALAAS